MFCCGCLGNWVYRKVFLLCEACWTIQSENSSLRALQKGRQRKMWWLFCLPSDPFPTVLHPALWPGRLTSPESTTWAPSSSGFHVARLLGATSRRLAGGRERSLIPPHLATFLPVSSRAVHFPQLQLSACFPLPHYPQRPPFQALRWYWFSSVASPVLLLVPQLPSPCSGLWK